MNASLLPHALCAMRFAPCTLRFSPAYELRAISCELLHPLRHAPCALPHALCASLLPISCELSAMSCFCPLPSALCALRHAPCALRFAPCTLPHALCAMRHALCLSLLPISYACPVKCEAYFTGELSAISCSCHFRHFLPQSLRFIFLAFSLKRSAPQALRS